MSLLPLQNKLKRAHTDGRGKHIGLITEEGTAVVRQKARPSQRHVKTFESAPELLSRIPLSGVAHRLVWYLLGKYQSNLPLTELKQRAIGGELGVSQSQVSRGYKELRKYGVVVVHTDGNEYLNMALFFTGTFEDLRDFQQADLEIGRKALIEQGIVDPLRI